MKILQRKSLLILLFVGISNPVSAYYAAGDTLSQTSLNKVVNYCANGDESLSLSALLIPEQGAGTRVLWINFFSSG